MKIKINLNDSSSYGPGDTTDIWDAAETGYLPAVFFYYTQDIKCLGLINKNSDRMTPLHYAARNGHLNIVKFLAYKKVQNDVFAGKLQETALMMASLAGHAVVVDFLLDMGAKINLTNLRQHNSLHIAISNGHLDVVKLLVQRNVNRFSKDFSGRTPLDLAIQLKKIDIKDYLEQLIK